VSKRPTRFKALEGFTGIYLAERDGLRCTAIRLRWGGLCLFSPVRDLGEDAAASLADLSHVGFVPDPDSMRSSSFLAEHLAFQSVPMPMRTRRGNGFPLGSGMRTTPR
jgi:hypothetical protein